MKKVVSVLAIASLLFVTVPPLTRAQQTKPPGPFIRIVPDPNPTSGLDEVYLSVNRTGITIWNARQTSPLTLTDLASLKTASSIAANHAQATGIYGKINPAVVANIENVMRYPTPTLVAEIQFAMKSFNGMVPSNAAIAAWLEHEAPRMPTVVAVYNAGGMAAVQSHAIAELQTYIARQTQAQGSLEYASYHPRLRPVLLDPSGLQFFVDFCALMVAIFAIAAGAGCGECDGAAAWSALAAAVGQLANDFSSTADQGPWVDGGANCSPCD